MRINLSVKTPCLLTKEVFTPDMPLWAFFPRKILELLGFYKSVTYKPETDGMYKSV